MSEEDDIPRTSAVARSRARQAPYKQSRAALRQMYGARSSGGSAPHSENDSMAGIGLNREDLKPMDSSLTPKALWENYFTPKSRNTTPNLAPAATPDAKAMAMAASNTGFLQNPTQLGALPPVKSLFAEDPLDSLDHGSPAAGSAYLGAAMKSATSWFDQNGTRPAPSALAPATSGTSFTSPYGSGSIQSGSDWMAKLRRLNPGYSI